MELSKTSAPIVQLLSDSMPKPIIDKVSETVTYEGYAPLGTNEEAEGWMITRTTIDGTVTKTEYAQGTMEYLSAWADRADYDYSR